MKSKVPSNSISNPSSRSTRIHRILAKTPATVFPGVYDPLSAKIAERAGFDAIFISGYSVAATYLGEPDFGLLTQTEIVDAARRVCRAVKVPVMIDADTGYGNALNVLRTVKELTSAGAAGMFLEDQVWPKRCGHMRGKKVISLEEQIEKLKAAQEARAESDFFIVARTDARQVLGLDEAIRRGKAFKSAGADAVFIEAPRSKEELVRIASEVEGPLVANMLEGGVTPILTREELGEIGFAFVVCPLTGLYATSKTLTDVFTHMRKEGNTSGLIERLLPFDQFHKIIDLEAYYELDDRFKIKE
jgi:2-methylisocitrate lyase-like PEP mutase family enzyme